MVTLHLVCKHDPDLIYSFLVICTDKHQTDMVSIPSPFIIKISFKNLKLKIHLLLNDKPVLVNEI